MSDEPGAVGEQRLVSRLRAVIAAKDEQIAVLQAQLEAVLAGLDAAAAGQAASRERERRLELRVAELERRLSMDSTDSGTPSSRERIGTKEARRARQQSERERRKDRKRGRAALPSGERPGTGSGPGRDADDGAARGVPGLSCRAGRGGGRGAAVGAGHRRGDHPEGDRVPAARPGMPVLRGGHVRGAAAGPARGQRVVRAGAECGRGSTAARPPETIGWPNRHSTFSSAGSSFRTIRILARTIGA